MKTSYFFLWLQEIVERYGTVGKAADVMEVSRDTVYQWVKFPGKIPTRFYAQMLKAGEMTEGDVLSVIYDAGREP